MRRRGCRAGTEILRDAAADPDHPAVIDWITRTVQNVAAAKAAVQPAMPAPIAGLS